MWLRCSGLVADGCASGSGRDQCGCFLACAGPWTSHDALCDVVRIKVSCEAECFRIYTFARVGERATSDRSSACGLWSRHDASITPRWWHFRSVAVQSKVLLSERRRRCRSRAFVCRLAVAERKEPGADAKPPSCVQPHRSRSLPGQRRRHLSNALHLSTPPQ